MPMYGSVFHEATLAALTIAQPCTAAPWALPLLEPLEETAGEDIREETGIAFSYPSLLLKKKNYFLVFMEEVGVELSFHSALDPKQVDFTLLAPLRLILRLDVLPTFLENQEQC